MNPIYLALPIFIIAIQKKLLEPLHIRCAFRAKSAPWPLRMGLAQKSPRKLCTCPSASGKPGCVTTSIRWNMGVLLYTRRAAEAKPFTMFENGG